MQFDTPSSAHHFRLLFILPAASGGWFRCVFCLGVFFGGVFVLGGGFFVFVVLVFVSDVTKRCCLSLY